MKAVISMQGGRRPNEPTIWNLLFGYFSQFLDFGKFVQIDAQRQVA